MRAASKQVNPDETPGRHRNPWRLNVSAGVVRLDVVRGTNVDDALVVADEQVAEDAGFVQVAQADHVLHPVDGGRVHGLDVGGILRGDPVFLRERGRERRERTCA